MKRVKMAIYGVAASLALIIPITSQAGIIVIESETEVLLRNTEELDSSKLKKGNIVEFEVVRAVRNKEGFIVIPENAYAYGVVAKSTKPGVLGAAGELMVSFDKVEAFNGQNIPLKGSQADRGESKSAENLFEAARGASQNIIPGESGGSAIDLIGDVAGTLFSKGASAVIPAGTRFKSYVAKTILFTDAIPANK